MRNLFAIVAVVLLGLTACSEDGIDLNTRSTETSITEAPAITDVTIEVPEASEVTQAPLSDDDINHLVFNMVMEDLGIDPDVVRPYAYEICGELDAGTPFSTLAEAMVEEGLRRGAFGADFEIAGAVVGAAVGAYCPQHEAQLDNLADPRS